MEGRIMPVEKEEPTDDELFNDAVADGEGDEPVTEAATEQQDVSEQAEQTEEITAEAEQADEGETADGRPPKPEPPAFRLKQEADARRQAEKDLADERAQRAAEKLDFERRLKALEKPAQQETRAEDDDGPDPLLDPKAYAKRIRDEVREEILNQSRETSLQIAHKTYKGEFEEAYKFAGERVDPALKAKMQASRDPGETLMSWYREQKTAQEIGGDLTAYKQRLRDEALKDPEFRKAAMAAWNAEAVGNTTQPNGRPNVKLPPSLNAASRANAAVRSSTVDDVSDSQLFEEMTAT